MLASSTLYRQALPYPTRRECRLEVFHAGVRVADDVPLVSGSVQARLASRVTRSAQFEVDPSYNVDLDALFDPDVAVVKISAGIGYPDGSREIFPIFTGRVWDNNDEPTGGKTFQAEDLAADVIGFKFERPESSILGNTIVEEIHRLINQVLSSAVFGVDDVTDADVPSLVWDEDRGRALDDLAQAVKGRWYALGDGSFVVRKYPYENSVPVITIADQSGGVLVRARRNLTRAGTANSITVVSERMDGTDPVRVTVRDIGATSPTRFGGPYGKVSQIIKVQTPLSTIEAQQLAQAQLSATLALKEQWTLEIEPDHTLEPADVIAIQYRSLTGVQVIDSITHPLVSGAMQVQGRTTSVPVAQTT